MIHLKKMINFMNIGNYMFPTSILIMLISLFLILFKGLNLGIDFTHGTRFDIAISNSNDSEITVEEIREIMDNLNLKEKYTIKKLTSDKIADDESENKKSEQMLSCTACGTFVHESLVVKKNGESFCSEDCSKS